MLHGLVIGKDAHAPLCVCVCVCVCLKVKVRELPWTKLKGVTADGAAKYYGKASKFSW
jgi:hypothetical protein